MAINAKDKAIQALWYSGCLQYKLHTGQQAIYTQLWSAFASGQKEFAMRIARQFGKSYLTVIIALELCIRNPGIIVRIAGPTLTSISDIVEDNLMPIIADAPQGLITRHRSTRRFYVNLPNGKKSELRLGTLERAHIDQTMRGGNAFAIFAEEAAASIKSEDLDYAMRSVIGPQLLRSSKKGGGLLGFVTTPAETPDHYFHKVIEPRCAAKGTFWTKTVYENPQLDADQIALAMERCGGEGSEAWQREYLCKVFRSTEVVIVPEFSEKHIYPFEIPEHKYLYTCIDFGISRDHHHAVLYYFDFLANKMCIVNEAHAPAHVATPEFLQQVRDMEAMDNFGPIRRFGDLSGRTEMDLKNTFMFDITQTAKDDKDAALTNLRTLIAQDRLCIHPRCVHTIACLRGGRWNNNRTDWMRTPELGHCDALAAVIYAARNLDTRNPLPLTRDNGIHAELRGWDRKQTGFKKLNNMWGAK